MAWEERCELLDCVEVHVCCFDFAMAEYALHREYVAAFIPDPMGDRMSQVMKPDGTTECLLAPGRPSPAEVTWVQLRTTTRAQQVPCRCVAVAAGGGCPLAGGEQLGVERDLAAAAALERCDIDCRVLAVEVAATKSADFVDPESEHPQQASSCVAALGPGAEGCSSAEIFLEEGDLCVGEDGGHGRESRRTGPVHAMAWRLEGGA